MPVLGAPQPMPALGPIGPMGKLRLVGEVLRTFRDVRRRMHGTDLRVLLAELRAQGPQPPREADREALRDAARLGRIVSRTFAPLPVDATCLARSLVLVAMLARRGLPGTLVIGVRPGHGAGDAAPARGLRARRRAARGEAPADGGFGAHAWVEVGGRPVLATGDFARLADL